MVGFKELSAKLDDVVGFIKHGVPHLASKTDIAEVKAEISNRPTRRQLVLDIFLTLGAIAAVMAIALHFAGK